MRMINLLRHFLCSVSQSYTIFLSEIGYYNCIFLQVKNTSFLSTNTLSCCFWLQVFVLVNVENVTFFSLPLDNFSEPFSLNVFLNSRNALYCTWHLFLPFRKYFRRLYLARNSNCFALMAPRRFFLINSTASSYFMPNSTKATATKTGARPKPVTQWTPTQTSAPSSNSFLTRLSHFSIISCDGGEPSEKDNSVNVTPDWARSSVLYVGSVAHTRWVTLCSFRIAIYFGRVESWGWSVIRNLMFLNSTSAGPGRISFPPVILLNPVGDGRLCWEVGEVGVCLEPPRDPTVPTLSFAFSISNTLPPIDAAATAAVVIFSKLYEFCCNKYGELRCQISFWQIWTLYFSFKVFIEIQVWCLCLHFRFLWFISRF